MKIMQQSVKICTDGDVSGQVSYEYWGNCEYGMVINREWMTICVGIGVHLSVPEGISPRLKNAEKYNGNWIFWKVRHQPQVKYPCMEKTP
ncbi:MAG: hypothetical protein K2M46_03485 [Lachnospiraceae bacterium]|nr:hypothetical protein [Lachnospiraceae bacterium]